jgi:hypothetical protein
MKCPNGKAIEMFEKMLSGATKGVCLGWPYGKGGQMGYGQLWDGVRKVYVHRLAWERTFGPLTEGEHVLHHCDNPLCFNPSCLFTGSEKDNRADQKMKGRTCTGMLNGVAKLTDYDVMEIRRLYYKGVKGSGQISLGKKFGVTRIAIRKIVMRQTWKHL